MAGRKPKPSIVSVDGAKEFQILQDFLIICGCSSGIGAFFFLQSISTKCKTFFVDVHSYVNCGIIHL